MDRTISLFVTIAAIAWVIGITSSMVLAGDYSVTQTPGETVGKHGPRSGMDLSGYLNRYGGVDNFTFDKLQWDEAVTAPGVMILNSTFIAL